MAMPRGPRDLVQLFWISRSRCRQGFSAAGRSSANPATADKAEKKKGGEGARRSTIGIVSRKDRCDLVCVGLSHGKAYTRLGKAEQECPFLGVWSEDGPFPRAWGKGV